jgi:hypothetical protein
MWIIMVRIRKTLDEVKLFGQSKSNVNAKGLKQHKGTPNLSQEI